MQNNKTIRIDISGSNYWQLKCSSVELKIKNISFEEHDKGYYSKIRIWLYFYLYISLGLAQILRFLTNSLLKIVYNSID